MSMASLQVPSLPGAHDMERSKSHRMALLRKLKPHKVSSEKIDRRSSLPQQPSPALTHSHPSRLPSTFGVQEPLSHADLVKHFSALYDVIIAHVRKFYSPKGTEERISQSVIEHASTGIALPWPQILGLLGNRDTRLATLALCIAWTILSRSLLVKLGTSNSPGSTFLPPEIVECFQSFSLGKGAVTLGKDETSAVNFALLSRWKQTTATLCHTTYVTDAFLFFDARTVNIERALKDIDPLLATYATPHDNGHGKNARLDDLRVVMRQGAQFAFMLFSQPCFWKFDWRSDRAVAHGKTEKELDPESTSSIESVGMASNTTVRLAASEIVVWPSLWRVMDKEGFKLKGDGEGRVLGKKRYLDEFASL